MRIKPKQYAESLFDSVKDASQSQAKKTVANLVQVLVANNQRSQVEKIISHFNLLWNKEKKIVEVEIISARKLDDKTLKILEKFIENKVESGYSIEMEEKIDKNIKGGFIVRLGDRILDASLTGKIRELRKTII